MHTSDTQQIAEHAPSTASTPAGHAAPTPFPLASSPLFDGTAACNTAALGDTTACASALSPRVREPSPAYPSSCIGDEYCRVGDSFAAASSVTEVKSCVLSCDDAEVRLHLLLHAPPPSPQSPRGRQGVALLLLSLLVSLTPSSMPMSSLLSSAAFLPCRRVLWARAPEPPASLALMW
jgi:hypothetical protein